MNRAGGPTTFLWLENRVGWKCASLLSGLHPPVLALGRPMQTSGTAGRLGIAAIASVVNFNRSLIQLCRVRCGVDQRQLLGNRRATVSE